MSIERTKWNALLKGNTEEPYLRWCISGETRYRDDLQQYMQYKYKSNNEARSCSHCCSGKPISITDPECVFAASVIQHLMHMRHIIWPAPALQYFSILSHKRHDFRKQVTEHKMCFSILSTPFVWNISHSKKNWARYGKKIFIKLLAPELYF